MGSQTPFSDVFKAIVDHAGAQTIYGEPISASGKTVVPVAKIRYGFGGGGGVRQDKPQHGGGGGGGMIAQPLGFIEITETQTRFVPIHSGLTLVAAVALGVCVGLLAGSRRAGN